MEIRLSDAELKIMNVLWRAGPQTAKTLAAELNEQVGWSKTTTYTLIKKCIDKGAVERLGTNFLCRPLISREQVRGQEAEELVNKLFDGSADQLVASLLSRKRLSRDEINGLRKIVEELE